ncbi:hypothetical protein K0M31_019426, partial [Melipona bicolor]
QSVFLINCAGLESDFSKITGRQESENNLGVPLRDTRSHPWVLNELLRKRVRRMVRSSMDANSDEFDAEFEIALDKSQGPGGLSFDRKFKGRWV